MLCAAEGHAHAHAEAPEEERVSGGVGLSRAVGPEQHRIGPVHVQQRKLHLHAPAHRRLQRPSAATPLLLSVEHLISCSTVGHHAPMPKDGDLSQESAEFRQGSQPSCGDQLGCTCCVLSLRHQLGSSSGLPVSSELNESQDARQQLFVTCYFASCPSPCCVKAYHDTLANVYLQLKAPSEASRKGTSTVRRTLYKVQPAAKNLMEFFLHFQ